MSIKSVAYFSYLKPSVLTDYYKNHLSDFLSWDQFSHAEDYILFPENMGPNLCIDETALSNGELVTNVINRSGHGKRGTLVAIIKGTKSEDIVDCLKNISQDCPGSSNSLTLSWLLVDEAKFIDYQKLKDETLPANGSIKSYFGKHSCNHSIMILSDMPQTQKGSWFLHYRDKMDNVLIKAIEGTIFEIWKTKQRIKDLNTKNKPVPTYLKGYLRRLDTSVNKMRSVAVYYREYSLIENLQLLG